MRPPATSHHNALQATGYDRRRRPGPDRFILFPSLFHPVTSLGDGAAREEKGGRQREWAAMGMTAGYMVGPVGGWVCA